MLCLYSAKSRDAAEITCLAAIHKERNVSYLLYFSGFHRVSHFSLVLQKTLDFVPLGQTPSIKTDINVVHKTERFFTVESSEHQKSMRYLQCLHDTYITIFSPPGKPY